MRKSFAALLAVLLTLSASLGLPACSGTNEPSAPEASETEDQGEEEPPASEELADSLFEEGEYKKALNAYKELEPSEEIEAKISECNFWLFADYVRDMGGMEKVDNTLEGNIYRRTYSVRVDDAGEIEASYVEETLGGDESGQSAATSEMHLTIPHDSNEAKVSASYEMTLVSAGHVEQTATGTMNVDTYKKGDSVRWDDTTDEARTYSSFNTYSLGINVLENNSGLVDGVLSYLSYCIRTGTGGSGTLADIGFSSYK